MSRLRHILIFGFATTLIGGGAVAWYAYAHFTDPETIRQLVLDKARVALPGALVRLANVQGNPLGDCKLIDFSISQPGKGDRRDEFFKLAQVTVTPDRRSLSEGRLLIHKLVLDKPVLHLQRKADGTWNFSQWHTDKPLTLSVETEIEIKDGTVAIEFADGLLPPMEWTDINATLKVGPPARMRWKLRMRHPLGQIQTIGDADLETKKATATVSTAGDFDLDRLRATLPSKLLEPLTNLRKLAAGFQTQIAASFDWSRGSLAWNGNVGGNLSNAEFDHPLMPYPIEKAALTFTADRAGGEIPQATFLFGSASGEVSARFPSWDKEHLEVAGTVANVQLTKTIYEALSPKLRLSWDKLSPQGSCDLAGSMRFVNGKPKLVGTAKLQDCSIAFHKFPYRVHKVRGVVELHPEGHFTFDCNGVGADATGTCRGMAVDLPGGPASDIEIVCKNAMIDDRLEAALDPPMLAIYRKFKAAGRGDVYARFTRKEGDAEPDFKIEIDCRLSKAICDWFPYEIDDVTGHLSIKPHQLAYSDFVGKSDRGTVRIDGKSVKTTEGVHVQTRVVGEEVALDDKLLCALPPGWDKTWNVLRPEGSANITCISVKPPDGPLDVQLTIDPAHAAITPTMFPYRLENFVGKVEFKDKRATWNQLKMMHDRTQWLCSGQVTTTPDGGRMTLWGLETRWLPLAGDFRLACPPKLQTIIDFIRPSRPIAVLLNQFDVQWQAEQKQSTVFNFDGQVGMLDTDIVPSVGLQNVTGGVSLVGTCTADRSDIQGNIDLEKFTISRFTARDVSGRLTAANDRVAIGNIKGNFYGGGLFGDVKADIGQRSGWEVTLRANNARLGRYVRETLRNPPALDGSVDVDLFLRGDGRTPDVDGSGRMHIRDADVVHLPVVQDLFKIINLQIPNGKAFDDISGNFTLKNKQMSIQDLVLTPSAMIGPALTLKSESGRIDLDTLRIELLLVSRYGKGKFKIPGVTDLLNGVSDNIMKTRVHGTLMEPITTLEPMLPTRRLFANPLNSRRD